MSFEKLTFESTINYPLRFMIDYNISGMSWIKVEKNLYKRIESNKISNCQIEASTDVKNLIVLSIKENSNICPLRILSFDIECSSENSKFPNPEKDPVVVISNIYYEFGKEKLIKDKSIFSYKKCADISGVNVYSFENESSLLINWKKYLFNLDPDVVTGFNINEFDFPYLLKRSEILKIKNFPFLSRIKNSISFHSKKTQIFYGFLIREFQEIKINGRIILDIYTYIRRRKRLSSYTLNYISKEFLNEQKDDVHYSLITPLWKKDEFTRRRLCLYCLKDSYLPLKIMIKLMIIINLIEYCRVTSIPINYAINNGQQITISTQLHKKTFKLNYLIPSTTIIKNDNKLSNSKQRYSNFEGASVLNPISGFYSKPIVTLDFSSLYPSIMIAHNLCYSTLIKKEEINNLNFNFETDYYKSPTGDLFVNTNIRKGIIPLILEELISERRKAKNQYNKEKNLDLKEIYNSRQKSYKTLCNSFYGFTGAHEGFLPCLQISSTITSIGREMIEMTKNLIIDKYSIKNGFKYNSNVIYGDTDSVMINFGVDNIKDALILGKESADYITSQFKKPIQIEFEKVFYPYLLLKKKRYAGIIWTNENIYDKIDAKGIETVRRDNCKLIKIMLENVIKKIFIENKVDDAVTYCKNIIYDLLQNKIDFSLLVITKSLNNEYHSKQPHVELVEKLKKRDKSKIPVPGERIPYLIIKGEKNSKNYENSESPLYALENDLEIDIDYYLNKQIKKPLLRIFNPILKNAEKILFQGEHIRKKTYINRKSFFSNFLIEKKTCFNCKSIINSGVVCKNCKDKLKIIYIENKMELINYQRMYCDLWVQCQKCQGSNFQDIICQNDDCSIFYKKIKVRKDLINITEKMKKFQELNNW